MWHNLVVALALVLVVEGVWPFVSPTHWRNMLLKIVTLDDRTLRVAGLVSMAVGLLLLHFIT